MRDLITSDLRGKILFSMDNHPLGKVTLDNLATDLLISRQALSKMLGKADGLRDTGSPSRIPSNYVAKLCSSLFLEKENFDLYFDDFKKK